MSTLSIADVYQHRKNKNYDSDRLVLINSFIKQMVECGVNHYGRYSVCVVKGIHSIPYKLFHN